jgi:hypothetical protein
MTDDAPTGQVQSAGFPSPTFPTVFADGVTSMANSASVVKFFLGRLEPSFAGDGRSQMQAFAQVVMPMDGFAMMFVFFEAQLRLLVQNGIVTEQRLSELRAVFTPHPRP